MALVGYRLRVSATRIECGRNTHDYVLVPGVGPERASYEPFDEDEN